jgi:hypothetical protein
VRAVKGSESSTRTSNVQVVPTAVEGVTRGIAQSSSGGEGSASRHASGFGGPLRVRSSPSAESPRVRAESVAISTTGTAVLRESVRAVESCVAGRRIGLGNTRVVGTAGQAVSGNDGLTIDSGSRVGGVGGHGNITFVCAVGGGDTSSVAPFGKSSSLTRTSKGVLVAEALATVRARTSSSSSGLTGVSAVSVGSGGVLEGDLGVVVTAVEGITSSVGFSSDGEVVATVGKGSIAGLHAGLHIRELSVGLARSTTSSLDRVAVTLARSTTNTITFKWGTLTQERIRVQRTSVGAVGGGSSGTSSGNSVVVQTTCQTVAGSDDGSSRISVREDGSGGTTQASTS